MRVIPLDALKLLNSSVLGRLMLIRLTKIRASTQRSQPHLRVVRAVRLHPRLNYSLSLRLLKLVASHGKKKKPSSFQTRQKPRLRASAVLPKSKMTMTMMSISQTTTKMQLCRESKLQFPSLVRPNRRMERQQRQQPNLPWAKRFTLQGAVEAGVEIISISGCAIVVNRRR